MPKTRDIAYLMGMVKALNVHINREQDLQEAVRRRVYPKVPPTGYNFNRWDNRFRISAFVPHEKETEYTLYVLSLGYSEHRGRVCDSWSTDWYRGPDDPRIWEHAHSGKKDASPFPGNDMERLAWEGKWREFAGYTPENEKLAIEHRRLESRIHQLWWRNGALMRGIQNIVDASLRKQQIDRYGKDMYYRQDRKIGPRVLLGGEIPCFYEGENLVFGEITDTFEVPLTETLPVDDRNWGYGIGSNAGLKRKIYDKQREKKNGR